MYAIPSRNGPYLTGGKKYFVRSGPGNTWEILDDFGHCRVIGTDDGHRSPHLPPMPLRRDFHSEELGTINFVTE